MPLNRVPSRPHPYCFQCSKPSRFAPLASQSSDMENNMWICSTQELLPCHVSREKRGLATTLSAWSRVQHVCEQARCLTNSPVSSILLEAQGLMSQSSQPHLCRVFLLADVLFGRFRRFVSADVLIDLLAEALFGANKPAPLRFLMAGGRIPPA